MYPARCKYADAKAGVSTALSERFIKRIYNESQRNAKFYQQLIDRPQTETEEEGKLISAGVKSVINEEIYKASEQKKILQNSTELKSWQNLLATAKASQELIKQLQESEERKKAMAEYKIKDRLDLEEHIRAVEEEERTLRLKEMKRKADLRMALMNQMEEQQRLRQLKHEETMRERKEMQRLNKIYENEILAEQQAKKVEKHVTNQSFIESIALHNKFKTKVRDLDRNEEENFALYMKNHNALEAFQRAKRYEVIQNKMKAAEEMGQRIYAKEVAKQSKYDALQDLLIQEKWYNDLKAEKLEAIQELEQRYKAIIEARSDRQSYRQQKKEREILAEKEAQREYEELIHNNQMLERKEYELSLVKKRQLQQEREKLLKTHAEKLQTKLYEKTEMERYYTKIEEISNEIIHKEIVRLLRNQPPDLLRYLTPKIYKEAQHYLQTKLPGEE